MACALVQYVRQRLSREEIELQDVEQQMEEELVQQHMLVERVVALKYDNKNEVRYLIKWKGLPYVECTWELTEDIIKAGGEDAIEDYKVPVPTIVSDPSCLSERVWFPATIHSEALFPFGRKNGDNSLTLLPHTFHHPCHYGSEWRDPLLPLIRKQPGWC